MILKFLPAPLMRTENVSYVKLILDHPNINIHLKNANGNNALLYHAYYGHNNIVKAIIKHPKIDAKYLSLKSARGVSTLEIVYCFTFSKCMKLLIARGADTSNWTEWNVRISRSAIESSKIMISWRSYLPIWTVLNHKVYPNEFDDILLICYSNWKQFNVCKDIRMLLTKYIARNWRQILDK